VLRSPRLLLVLALWVAALWPLLVLALGAVSPVAGVRAGNLATRGIGWTLWGTAALAVALVVFYPPFVPGLRLRLRRLWQRLGTSDKPVRDAYARLAQLETVNDHFAVGRFLRERGQAAPAVKHLQRAVELDAGHLGARYQLALARRDAGDLQAAVDELQRVIAVDAGFASGQPLLDLATILLHAHLHAEADALLAHYRRLHGDTRVALVLQARALAGVGRREDGVALLRQAASPPATPGRVTAEEAHARARARVALWFGGFR
jgi:tetratricopeptide (TPR) repeat protein